jgi:hypothetical protein
MSLKEKLLILIFGLVFFVSAVIRFEQTKNGQFPFTYDQARDMLDIRVLGEFKDLWVMGPTTSINGLRLGPFYYYLMLPAYWFGGGDPQALVNWNTILFLISGLTIFLYFQKKDIVLGTIIATIYLMAPRLFDTTRYFWNANSAVYLSVYYFLALFYFLEKKNKKAVFWLATTASMVLQFEAAWGIVLLIFSGMILILNKKMKYWGQFVLGALPWFLPQIFLEIKNKFLMSKLLLGIFNGSNEVLKDKLRWPKIIPIHFKSMISCWEGQFNLPLFGGLILIILTIIGFIFFKKYKRENKYLWGLWLFGLVFYSLIYHYPLKAWYLEGLRVWMAFVVGIFLRNVMSLKKIWVLVIILFLGRSILMTMVDQKQYLQGQGGDDPKNMANLKKNIDWIYEKSGGEAFKAMNFVPEIFDLPQQYLYWWYGAKKYGYRPKKVSYSLTEVPEYIPKQGLFSGKEKSSDKEILALTYEIRYVYYEWLKQFKNYCVVHEWETEWKTKLEIREKCPLGKIAP